MNELFRAADDEIAQSAVFTGSTGRTRRVDPTRARCGGQRWKKVVRRATGWRDDDAASACPDQQDAAIARGRVRGSRSPACRGHRQRVRRHRGGDPACRRAAIEVSLLEMRDQPGGRAYVYRQDGFTFDAGPTIVTAPFLIDELFALGGRRTEDYVRIVPCHPVLPDRLSRRPHVRLHRRRGGDHRADSPLQPRRRGGLSAFRRPLAGDLRPGVHRPGRPAVYPASGTW